MSCPEVVVKDCGCEEAVSPCPCSCEPKVDVACLQYTGDNLVVSEILTGDCGNTILEKIEAKLAEMVALQLECCDNSNLACELLIEQ